MIGIVGGGPGGLAAARALQIVGREVVVLEQADALRTAGAGLMLQVNAMRMLAAMDLAAPVAAVGIGLTDGEIGLADGTRLNGMPLGPLGEKWGQPSIALHRGALSRVLAEGVDIRFGACVEAIEDVGDAVQVVLASGETQVFDAVIGADGIHSAVREALFGPVPLRYAGYTCWRGLARIDQPLGPGCMSERWGIGRRFGIVPIAPDCTYWFATETTPPDGKDGDALAEARQRFGGFAAPVPAILDATDVILRNDIVDFAPIDAWGRGRVTLIGDAAHAMTPNLGQGAGQAIEDAVVLAACLGDGPVEPGLRAYEAARMARAREFVQRSWWMGWMGQFENPVARWARAMTMRLTPPGVMESELDRVYRVEVPTLRAARR